MQPGEGKFAVRLGVIERNDLVFEQLIKTVRVSFVLKFNRAVINLSPNRPAVVAVVSFTPPAIEHAEIDPAIWRRFHSARPARLQRTKRMVQPKVDTLHETACYVAIVIFQKHDAIFKASVAAQFINLLDKRFACLVTRMRFACENELHGSRRVVEQSFEPFFVAEQEGTAFVGRETARKANGQNFRVKNAIDLADALERFAHALAPSSLPFAYKLNETELKFLVRLPELCIRNIDDAAPKLRFSQMFLPCAEMPLIKRRKLRRHPGFCVDAVRDAGDRHFLHRHAGPDSFPKRSS